MKSLSWYLAYSYIPFRKGEYAVTTMAIISFISIAIGSFALALVTAIMNGFQVSIHEKMQNIHPSATIYSRNDPIAFPALKKAITKEFPEITALSPYSISHLMISSDGLEQDELPIVVQMKAFNPTEESHVSSLAQKMLHGSLANAQKNHVVIGKSLAATLGVRVGDPSGDPRPVLAVRPGRHRYIATIIPAKPTPAINSAPGAANLTHRPNGTRAERSIASSAPFVGVSKSIVTPPAW